MLHHSGDHDVIHLHQVGVISLLNYNSVVTARHIIYPACIYNDSVLLYESNMLPVCILIIDSDITLQCKVIPNYRKMQTA